MALRHSGGSERSGIPLFMVALALLMGLLHVLHGQGYLGRPLMGLAVMYGVAVVALPVSLGVQRPRLPLGWRLPPLRWLVLAFLLPLMLGALVYAPLWLSGAVKMDLAGFANHLNRSLLGWAQSPAPLEAFLLMLAIGFPVGVVYAFGEELGWSGYLIPALLRRGGYVQTSLLLGVTQALYHLPAILFLGYSGSVPLLRGLPAFMVFMGGMAFASVYLRLRTRSLWPGVVLHAAHNLSVLGYGQALSVPNRWTDLLGGEFGFGLAVLYAGLAALLVSRQRGYGS